MTGQGMGRCQSATLHFEKDEFLTPQATVSDSENAGLSLPVQFKPWNRSGLSFELFLLNVGMFQDGAKAVAWSLESPWSSRTSECAWNTT